MYVKAHIYKYDGRVNVKYLRDRCENASMQEQYINEAKLVLANISYKS